MKFWIGLGLMVLGVVAGLYVGVWLCFAKGIVAIIGQIKAPEIDALVLAWGIARIPLAGILGWLSALVLIVPGYFMLDS